jgi:TPR repeat protein
MTTTLKKGASIMDNIQSFNNKREQIIKEHLEKIDGGNSDPKIINSLANFYYHDEKNYPMAKKYYQMGADVNHLNSIVNLGDYYKNIEHDYLEMKKIYQIGIDQCNTNCILSMAIYHKEIDNDYNEMKKYYKMAFDNGDNRGMHQLALFYKYNNKDYDKMKECFNLAIEKDCSESMYSMGVYYEDIETNYELMKKYYELAIKHKNARAMFALGYYYEKYEEDIEMAKEYYLMGCFENNEQCILKMANYYKNTKDIENMIVYYKKLIPFKNPEAFYEMAKYYLIQKNNVEIAEEYIKVANYLGFEKNYIDNIMTCILLKKNEEECSVMVKINIKNIIIKINCNEEQNQGEFDKCITLESKIYFLQLRADKGYTEAMFNVGIYYIMNLDDYVNGFKYLYKMLEYIKIDNCNFGFDDKFIKKKFIELIQNDNNKDAMLFLALFYLENDNNELAEKYLLQSVENNNFKAYDYLSLIYSNKRGYSVDTDTFIK